MSKLFDAVQKDGVIDFGDLSGDETGPVCKTPELATTLHPNISAEVKTNRVLRLRASALSPVFPFDEAQSRAAEQYRIIRTKLLHHSQKPQLTVVSSASSGDGKTITSINIAGSLALRADSQILLVDGDLRRPRVHAELDIPIAPGLGDVLSGGVLFEEVVVQAAQFPNLFILPAGSPAGNPAELLESPQYSAFLAQIRARFSHVIFDAPPVATVTDYELLQHGCDGVLLVARPDHSNRASFLKSLEIVPSRKLLGVILNCVEDWWLWKTPGYGYYRDNSSKIA
jgi:capsular exopolysaccharide synthesis family protein